MFSRDSINDLESMLRTGDDADRELHEFEVFTNAWNAISCIFSYVCLRACARVRD